MLEEFIRILCFFVMALSGYYIIKVLTKRNETLFEIKNFLLILVLTFLPYYFYKVEYNSTQTLLTYLTSIVVYKEIFKLNTTQSFLNTSIMMIIIFLADLLVMLIFMGFTTIKEIRGVSYIQIIINLLTSLICIIVSQLLKKQNYTSNLNNKFYSTSDKTSIIFFFLLIVSFTIITINFYKQYGWNSQNSINIIICLLFIILFTFFMYEKKNYTKLSDEFDNLYSYVQHFEDWIEKEQLNRHEYKNQLAVLRSIATQKQVKEKIDKILEDNINIEKEVIHQFKNLPKGGLKGLMYYKAAIAQKEKIKLTVDVSINKKTTELKKLPEEKRKVLFNLIGIYFDNAIEAAKTTRKKIVMLEIYEIKGKINFVISNTYKRGKNFEKRNEKGTTTKGKGRGNGLYFAKNLIEKNKWLEEKQEEIGGYYIQKLIIKTEKTIN